MDCCIGCHLNLFKKIWASHLKYGVLVVNLETNFWKETKFGIITLWSLNSIVGFYIAILWMYLQ